MPVYIGVDDLKDTATNEMLEQGYVVAESDVRLRILYTFLKKNKTKKMMVFFSSCMSVKFHYEVLPVGNLKKRPPSVTQFFCSFNFKKN